MWVLFRITGIVLRNRETGSLQATRISKLSVFEYARVKLKMEWAACSTVDNVNGHTVMSTPHE